MLIIFLVICTFEQVIAQARQEPSIAVMVVTMFVVVVAAFGNKDAAA
jgi:hypothetical protein